MMIVGVDDLEEARADLRAGGAEPGPVRERPDRGIRFTHFPDPAGNLIEVNEPIPVVEE